MHKSGLTTFCLEILRSGIWDESKHKCLQEEWALFEIVDLASVCRAVFKWHDSEWCWAPCHSCVGTSAIHFMEESKEVCVGCWDLLWGRSLSSLLQEVVHCQIWWHLNCLRSFSVTSTCCAICNLELCLKGLNQMESFYPSSVIIIKLGESNYCLFEFTSPSNSLLNKQ